jgi:hypothetical protein
MKGVKEALLGPRWNYKTRGPKGRGIIRRQRAKIAIHARNAIVIFVLSVQNDCFLLGHENEFLVETVRSRLQTHSNGPTKQSSFARNTNTIFSTTAF